MAIDTGSATRVRERVIVAGRVQGVFFRSLTLAHARRLGVDGWVRNRADGSVEAVFEGEPGAVTELVTSCSQGPAGSRVVWAEVHTEEPVGERGFDILDR